MFNNIGGKIKGLAKFLFWLEFIGMGLACLIAGIIAISHDEPAPGLLLIFIGIPLVFLFAWISAFFMVGFGQLIEDTEKNRKTSEAILRNMGGASAPSYSQPIADNPASDTWVCPTCGSVNDMSSNYCTRCGKSRQ